MVLVIMLTYLYPALRTCSYDWINYVNA